MTLKIWPNRSLALGLLTVGLLIAGAASAGRPILGFSAANADAERALEAKFDAQLSPTAIGERLKRMASQPNQVGSPHNKDNAEFTLAQFKAWGWDAHIETFDVLYPTPLTQSLQLLGISPYSADLSEPPVPGDETSHHTQGALPGYLVYGADGDVTASLVYVNYGTAADYQALQLLGIDVRGKIVITRYGQIWRGLKVKFAAEHGAVGCIIYSDPADDGFVQADAYTNGGARSERSLQRGSVMDEPVAPGDPLTPGIGSVAGAPRISLAAATTIARIPAVPISWGDAQHFLAALGGPVAPRRWRGGLPLTYHVGGAGAQVHLMVKSDWTQKPIYDVIGMIKGKSQPDQWIIRGNHRDGWVYGAQDPLSGQTALMEEAKSIGALVKAGWRPERTLVYASWDGEEPGLLGSTEWAETHAQELQAKAALYVNSDENGRGFLQARATYSVRRLIDQTAADVLDPQTGVSLKARDLAQFEVMAISAGAGPDLRAAAKALREGGDLPIGDLGGGSDFSPFAEHLGIATIDFGFGGEGQSGGAYHSAYDTYEHFTRFGDPGFAYGVAMAKMGGHMVLRSAQAQVLPLQFGNLAMTVADQVEELKRLMISQREQAKTVNRLIQTKAFTLAADPTQTSVEPEPAEITPDLDFAPLATVAARLTRSAEAYDTTAALMPWKGNVLLATNQSLQAIEQSLTDARGLPGRPWYKHLIFAAGLLNGYGGKTLPGVREAIEAHQWAEAQDYIGRTAMVLMSVAAKLDALTVSGSPNPG